MSTILDCLSSYRMHTVYVPPKICACCGCEDQKDSGLITFPDFISLFFPFLALDSSFPALLLSSGFVLYVTSYHTCPASDASHLYYKCLYNFSFQIPPFEFRFVLCMAPLSFSCFCMICTPTYFPLVL